MKFLLFDCFGYNDLQRDYDTLLEEHHNNVALLRKLQIRLSPIEIRNYIKINGSIFPYGRSEDEMDLLEKFAAWVIG